MKTWKRVLATALVSLLAAIGAIVVATPASASVWGPFYIHNLYIAYCIDVPNASFAAGEQLKLTDVCSTATTYYFIDTDLVNPNQYFIQVIFNGYYIQPGAPLLYNSTIIQWEPSPSIEQRWHTIAVAGGGFWIQNLYSGYCLKAESLSPGAYIRQGTCVNDHYTVWWI